MNAPGKSGLPPISLKDPQLFRTQAYVDGAWADAEAGKTFPVTNPASGETLAVVPDMGASETRRAIETLKK